MSSRRSRLLRLNLREKRSLRPGQSSRGSPPSCPTQSERRTRNDTVTARGRVPIRLPGRRSLLASRHALRREAARDRAWWRRARRMWRFLELVGVGELRRRGWRRGRFGPGRRDGWEQWLVERRFVVGRWLVERRFVVEQWLVERRFVVGQWLVGRSERLRDSAGVSRRRRRRVHGAGHRRRSDLRDGHRHGEHDPRRRGHGLLQLHGGIPALHAVFERQGDRQDGVVAVRRRLGVVGPDLRGHRRPRERLAVGLPGPRRDHERDRRASSPARTTTRASSASGRRGTRSRGPPGTCRR